jgi:hypothetical protein
VQIVEPPTVQPIREIVKHGYQIIPLLLEHLTDLRTTRCEISFPHMIILGEHLDMLEADFPQSFDFDSGWKEGRTHQVTVGDLCYVSLGQIVNRNYSAFYYLPSLMTIVNSPAINPKVAEKARNLWSACDRVHHINLLVSDLTDTQILWRRADAITRLLFFFPDVGTNQVIRELRRPTYSVYQVNSVIDSISIISSDMPDLGQLNALLDRFDPVTLYGVLDDFPRRSKWSHNLKANAALFADALSRRIGALELTPISATFQTQFVDHLQSFTSPIIDQAVWELLSTIARTRLEGEPATQSLAISCAKRLIDSHKYGPAVGEICKSASCAP